MCVLKLICPIDSCIFHCSVCHFTNIESSYCKSLWILTAPGIDYHFENELAETIGSDYCPSRWESIKALALGCSAKNETAEPFVSLAQARHGALIYFYGSLESRYNRGTRIGCERNYCRLPNANRFTPRHSLYRHSSLIRLGNKLRYLTNNRICKAN